MALVDVKGGEWAMEEQLQISGEGRRLRRGMEREDWDKTGGGEGGEGQSGEKWRELISIDHRRQLHYQHLLDTPWIHNRFLPRVGGGGDGGGGGGGAPESVCV